MGWVGKGKGSPSRGGSATSELFQNNSIFSVARRYRNDVVPDWLTYSFFAFFSLLEKTETLDKKRGPTYKKRFPAGPRYPEGDPFENNASVGSLFWVSICSSAACFPGSGLNEELGKMKEPGLNFCRARFAIVSSTCCNFFAFFLPPALNQHLIAACQCQNKSLVHFLLQEKAIFQSQFLKKRAKN